MKKILILGGAGFIGSNLAEFLQKKKYEITIIDGLLKFTGGNKNNLSTIINKINCIFKPIEKIENIDKIIQSTDIIINAMSWTRHHYAITDPIYDLNLNCKSHLILIKSLKKISNKKIIVLSTTNIYGNPKKNTINENTIPNPLDIHGIHKFTMEFYYKFYSELFNQNVIILRFPNCYGEKQPFEGDDIGLVGSFIRNALLNKTIEIYGTNRKKSIIYVKDITSIIESIINATWKGFNTYNISGKEISLLSLAKKIVKLTGKGSIIIKKMPDNLKKIDNSNIKINSHKLYNLIGKIKLSNIDESLIETINYFKEKIN
ncbi:MAG TPA: NAD(P)-dependent oxidoreductase [Ignavibacteria bacterium]